MAGFVVGGGVTGFLDRRGCSKVKFGDQDAGGHDIMRLLFAGTSHACCSPLTPPKKGG